MEPTRKLTDEKIEALLAGGTPAEGLDGLAAFVRSVPDALASTPGEHVASTHLARMIDAASDPATAGPRTAAKRHSRRRRNVLSTIFGTLAAKLAVVAVAAAAATGGLAATNNLPAPAQNAVSTAFSHLGVHFPSSHAGGKSSSANSNSSSSNNEHGKSVSETAKTTTDTGRAKGETVSGVASTTGQDHRTTPAGPDGVSQNPTGNGNPGSVPPDGGYNQDTHPTGNPTGNGQPDSVPPADHGKS